MWQGRLWRGLLRGGGLAGALTVLAGGVGTVVEGLANQLEVLRNVKGESEDRKMYIKMDG